MSISGKHCHFEEKIQGMFHNLGPSNSSTHDIFELNSKAYGVIKGRVEVTFLQLM